MRHVLVAEALRIAGTRRFGLCVLVVVAKPNVAATDRETCLDHQHVRAVPVRMEMDLAQI